jgi:hypothetical protein
MGSGRPIHYHLETRAGSLDAGGFDLDARELALDVRGFDVETCGASLDAGGFDLDARELVLDARGRAPRSARAPGRRSGVN